MVISVAALQFPLGEPIALEDKLHLFRRKPDFVGLPEYFAVRPTDRSHADGAGRIEEHWGALQRLSRDLNCTVIAGTVAKPIDGGYANTAALFDRGELIGEYQKVNPVGREEERGIIPGREYRVFDIRGVRVGILICADALSPDAFAAMGEQRADIVFIPTVSPLREADTVLDKDRRDTQIFVAGAQKACAYVVKTCGIGTIFGGRLQGRSGIFAPWGILNRVPPDAEQRKLILTEHLDLDEIREFKTQMRPVHAVAKLAPAIVGSGWR